MTEILWISEGGEIVCGCHGHGGQYLADAISRKKSIREGSQIITPLDSWIAVESATAGLPCEYC